MKTEITMICHEIEPIIITNYVKPGENFQVNDFIIFSTMDNIIDTKKYENIDTYNVQVTKRTWNFSTNKLEIQCELKNKKKSFNKPILME